MTSSDETLNMADIARLAGVQRPVVSMWRQRSKKTSLPFPAPVSESGGRPVFDVEDVMTWLAATGRAPEDNRGWDADRLVRLVTHRGDAELADAVLCVFTLYARLHDFDCVRKFTDAVSEADELDPDELFLVPLVLGCESVWGAAVSAVESANVSVADFVDAMVTAMPLDRGAADFVASVVTLCATQDLGVCVSVDSSDGSRLVWSVAWQLTQHDVTVVTGAPDSVEKQRFVCWLVACGAHPFADPAPGSVVVRLSEAMSAASLEAVLATALQVCTDGESLSLGVGGFGGWFIMGPASHLCAAVGGEGAGQVGAGQVVAETVRLGVLEAAVRLPSGLVKSAPRVELGFWSLNVAVSEGSREVPVWGYAVAPGLVSAAGAEEFADDLWTLRKALAYPDSSSGVGRRHGPSWRKVRRVQAAVGREVLAPDIAYTFGRGSVSQMDRATAILRRGVDPVLAYTTVTRLDDAQRERDVSLGHLVDQELLSVIPGLRVPGQAYDPEGRFEVWEAGSLHAAVLRTIHIRELPRGADRGRETEPGDVVFVSGHAPDAVVDPVGGRIPAFPCRIMRLNTEARQVSSDVKVSPYAVADALRQAAGSRVAWRSARVRQFLPTTPLSAEVTVECLAEVARHARELAHAAEFALESAVRLPNPRLAGVVAKTQESNDDKNSTECGPGVSASRKEGGFNATS